MKLCPRRRTVAALLALGLAASTTGTWSRDPGSVHFSGRVLQQDGATPRAGVVVTLVDRGAERTFDSSPTGEDGTFRIEGPPAGSYAVLARGEEGIYLAAADLPLASGDNPPLQLTLKPSSEPILAPGQSSPNDGLPAWAKGLIAGGLVIAGYLLWDELTESEASTEVPF